ncbi:hypothetical protein [Azospirillum endophyticum]
MRAPRRVGAEPSGGGRSGARASCAAPGAVRPRTDRADGLIWQANSARGRRAPDGSGD